MPSHACAPLLHLTRAGRRDRFRSRPSSLLPLQHDDGVDAEARTHVQKITKGRKANGCDVSVTMFTQADLDGWTCACSRGHA